MSEFKVDLTKSEAEIKADTLIRVSQLPNAVLWNNPRGVGWMGRPSGAILQNRISLLYPRRVAFGGPPGAADTLGFVSITITPDMVGKRVAVASAFELKDAQGRATPEQMNFLARLAGAGGIAAIVRHPMHALNAIKNFKGVI